MCLIEEELVEEVVVEEGSEEMADHCEREKQSIGRQIIVKGKRWFITFFGFIMFFFVGFVLFIF